MEQIIIGISLIYIVLIIYVHYRYNHDPKTQNQYELYREELEIEPAVAAYLIDEDCQWTNIILADILTLVKQGYIMLEKQGDDYLFIKVANKKLEIENHQMMAYRTLFYVNRETVERITLNEFKEQMQQEVVIQNLQIKEYAIKDAIRLELEKQGLIDKKSRKKLMQYNKLSITFFFLSLITCIISIFTGNFLYVMVSIFWIMSSILFYIMTNCYEEKLTLYGAECKEKAIGLKNYIKEYMISEDKPIDTVNVLDYYYIMAVAIGEADLAEEEFIDKNYQKEKREYKKETKNSKYREMIQNYKKELLPIHGLAFIILFFLYIVENVL